LLLVPAGQAFANGTITVNIEGSGNGEVNSVGGLFEGGAYEGSPPVECTYKTPGPATGICESELSNEGEGFEAVNLKAVPDPGSELAGWVFTEGFGLLGCDPEEGTQCLAGQFTGEGNVKVTAVIECETEGGCEEGPSGPELTVTKEGTGTGTVVSSPAGIECGATCTAAFTEGSKVTLTASPSAGSLFVSWKGCEKGGVLGRQCTVTMDKAKTVNAKFLTAYDVTVNRVGSGLGKVSSSPGGVLCLSNCSSTTAAFKEGTSVTLNAAPTKNFVFTEWTGDCSGVGPCSLGALGEDKEVGAKFTEVAKHLLTVNKSGGGQGTAKSNLAGINCGATCSSMASAYYQGAVVELTATPGKGSAFGGWSGSGCSGTGTCTVTMSAAKSVTAEFK
jgi:hypothetical protein